MTILANPNRKISNLRSGQVVLFFPIQPYKTIIILITIKPNYVERSNTGEQPMSYSKKVWIKGSIYALIIILLLLINATFSVLLLILAGSLIAVFFTGLSDLICRKTEWKKGICLAISIIGTMLLVVGFFG